MKVKLFTVCFALLSLTGCFGPQPGEPWYVSHAIYPTSGPWLQWYSMDAYAGPPLNFDQIDQTAALNRQADAIETQNIILQGQANNAAAAAWQRH